MGPAYGALAPYVRPYRGRHAGWTACAQERVPRNRVPTPMLLFNEYYAFIILRFIVIQQ